MTELKNNNEAIKDLVIIGAGGFGREIAWLVEDINKDTKKFNLLGFIDDDSSKKGSMLNGYEVLGDLSYFESNKDVMYVCAIGNARIKSNMVKRCDELGIKAATLIHPNVHISNEVEIGDGIIICAGCIVTVNIKLGRFVTVNLLSTIGHDVEIDDFVTIYPGVCVSGNCHLGKAVEVGTKTAIIQGLNVGENTIIGAGSVVVKSLPKNCTAVGIPAKAIKYFEVEE